MAKHRERVGMSAFRRGVLACIAVLAAAGLWTSPATAFEVAPEFLLQIPSTEETIEDSSAAGRLFIPIDVTTSPDGARVYVLEEGGERVSVFSPWGEFIEAFGWGVLNGASVPQTCTASSGCEAGVKGAGAAQFRVPKSIVADATGDLYVADSENNRVEKLGPHGEFLLMFGREVNKTTHADICTKAQLEAGNECGAGVAGATAGEFTQPSAVEMGPEGNVYVGDQGSVQVFTPNGSFVSELAALPDSEWSVEALAFEGDRLLADFALPVPQFVHDVYEYTGGSWRVFAAVERPSGLAVGPEGEIYVARNLVETNDILELDPTGKELATFGSFEVGFLGQTQIKGLATNRLGDLYVPVHFIKLLESRSSYVSVYGPPPSEIEPAPVKQPTIVSQYAAKVGAEEATLRAQINPHFFGGTAYYAEYGPQPCSASACTAVPAPPGEQLPGGEQNKPLTTHGVFLAGLAPESTYYYRFTAISGSFTKVGSDRSFTTRRPNVPGLLDGRAYEKVSPADKNGGEAGVPKASVSGPFELDTPRPQQSAPDGETLTYPSFAAFGNAAGAGSTSQYLSRRTSSGWQSANITPPNRGTDFRDPVRGFSPDLSVAAVAQADPPLLPGATPGVENLYLQDNNGGNLRLLTTSPPAIAEGLPKYCITYFGASSDLRHIIFSADGGLTPEAPVNFSRNLYEWSDEAGLRLVSILPDGSPAVSSGFGATSFGGSAQETNCGSLAHISLNAISADGSRIFWTYGGGSYAGMSTPLFARVNGQETVQLDANQGGAGPGGKGHYWAATPDGEKVLFSDPNKLIGGARPGDLYIYDFTAGEGERLTDLTAGPQATETLGVLATSGDLSRIYFAAKGILSGGQENARGEKAVAGARNLYLWQEGQGIRFVAILAGAGDVSDWGGTIGDPSASEPQSQTARATPDGRYLAFLSAADLSGYDNVDQATDEAVSEAYLYDAESGRLICASCNPTGARPTAATTFPTWRVALQQPRYVRMSVTYDY